MSRSGYVDDGDIDQWALIRWRGAVKSAIRGKNGQAFLREMRDALDKMVFHQLIAEELEKDGAVCALGALGSARGIDMSEIDPYDYETVSARFRIPETLAREIVYMNDDEFWRDTPRKRWERMRAWIDGQIKEPSSSAA